MIYKWLGSSDWFIFITLIIVFGGNALLLHYLCFRKKSREFILSFQGVVAPFFVMAATIFALTTALLGNLVWQTFHNNSQAIDVESQALTVFIELNQAVPKIKNYDLAELAKNYTKFAVDTEWDLLKQKQKSPETNTALIALLSSTIEATSQPEIPFPAAYAMITAVNNIAQARAARLSLLNIKTGLARWVCVLLLALVTQVGVAVVHLEKPRANALALLITTATIVIALGLIALADSSHSIKESVSIEPLRAILTEKF
jgi:hypothetical protein